MPIKIASLVKFYITLLLMEHPKHGYELMKEIEARIGKAVSASQVYPFLELLQKEGYIQVQKTGRRDKITYSMTKEGRAFTKNMLARSGDLFYLAVKPHISVCTHCGCKVLEGGHKEKRAGKELMFCCHFCARSFGRQSD